MKELALAQVALPLAMAAWLVSGRAPSLGDFLLRLSGAWLLLAGVWMAGIWLALPWRSAQLLTILLLIASMIGAFRGRSTSSVTHSPFARWGARLAAVTVALLGLWLAGPALSGRHDPGSILDLAFPFKSGRYIVVNGGSSERINGHFMTLGPRFRKWRGESYGVDLIRVDGLGFRTRRPAFLKVSEDPAAYLSFGEEVSSPCNGTVLAAAEDRPDMPVPKRDRRHLEGNFVLLRCGGFDVLLAHFRRGHVEVGAGQAVRTGQALGQVGNSGNTDEPHLHVHVQEQGSPAAPFAAAPRHATFEGRFLVRNMIVSAN